METKELLKKVRRIEIKTRGLSQQVFSGQYHSTFKGRGMAFSEVREYQPGDEIRTIDWNVTARFNHPYVKVFQEERELNVMLLIDISNSQSFGSSVQDKRELITELAAVLSFSAGMNNDKIGAILFSDKVEKFIAPKKGRKHILHIIAELLNFESKSKGTDISQALRFFDNVIKKRSILFVISDFIDKGFEDSLKITNRKHDVVALRVHDPRESSLPNIGIVPFQDAETGQIAWVNTSSVTTRKTYEKRFREDQKYLDDVFTRSKIDHIKLATGEDYIRQLVGMFKNHAKKR
ncbi:MAG TPA: DUF58 domain-containing protein [Flavobacteriales bacterium]|nr:DUF58 domain-containing protein [Flavobacteriales bacterium]